MSQPTPFDRQSSFALFSAENPLVPHSGVSLDAEFNAVKLSLDETQQNLALIQDDDGVLKRGSVGKAQFDSSVTIGFGSPGQWVAGKLYTANVDTVFNASIFYICKTTHTSGVSFDATKWTVIADFTVAAVISDGSITSAKLAAAAVDASKIADGSISNSKIASGAVTTTKIADGAITIAKVDTGIGPELAKLVIPAGLGPLPWSGLNAPTGWVFTGGTYLRTTYPALWAFAAAEIAAGNTLYGVGDGVSNFTITSMEGHVPAGRESVATFLTSSFFAGNSTVLGARGGGESVALSQSNLPAYNLSPTFTQPVFTTDAAKVTATTNTVYGTGASGPVNFVTGTGGATLTRTVDVSATIPLGGSGTSHRTVQPTRIVNFIVKAH